MSTIQLEPNRELIEQCKQGEQTAFKALYNQYAKAMYNVANRIVKDDEEAKDTLQEAFIKAFNKIDQYQYDATFGAWLKRIVINQALDVLRKRKDIIINQEEEIEVAEVEDTDWKRISLTVERVKKAILQLPTGFRTVCSLHLFEGFEHKEIGEILGISEGTSKSQFHRAKIKLKEIIKEYEIA